MCSLPGYKVMLMLTSSVPTMIKGRPIVQCSHGKAATGEAQRAQ